MMKFCPTRRPSTDTSTASPVAAFAPPVKVFIDLTAGVVHPVSTPVPEVAPKRAFVDEGLPPSPKTQRVFVDTAVDALRPVSMPKPKPRQNTEEMFIPVSDPSSIGEQVAGEAISKLRGMTHVKSDDGPVAIELIYVVGNAASLQEAQTHLTETTIYRDTAERYLIARQHPTSMHGVTIPGRVALVLDASAWSDTVPSLDITRSLVSPAATIGAPFVVIFPCAADVVGLVDAHFLTDITGEGILSMCAPGAVDHVIAYERIRDACRVCQACGVSLSDLSAASGCHDGHATCHTCVAGGRGAGCPAVVYTDATLTEHIMCSANITFNPPNVVVEEEEASPGAPLPPLLLPPSPVAHTEPTVMPSPPRVPMIDTPEAELDLSTVWDEYHEKEARDREEYAELRIPVERTPIAQRAPGKSPTACAALARKMGFTPDQEDEEDSSSEDDYQIVSNDPRNFMMFTVKDPPKLKRVTPRRKRKVAPTPAQPSTPPPKFIKLDDTIAYELRPRTVMSHIDRIAHADEDDAEEESAHKIVDLVPPIGTAKFVWSRDDLGYDVVNPPFYLSTAEPLFEDAELDPVGAIFNAEALRVSGSFQTAKFDFSQQ